MEPTMYMIDPRGDTLLILYNANSGDMTRDSALRWDNNLPQYLTREAQRNDMMLGILPPSAETSPGDGEREVWMRLSSKHLSLASAYFQRLISGDWTETQPKDGYSYTITAQEWDEKALVLLMNIIHGRTTHVPRCVSVEMLAKLGILVNYYKCYEAVKFYTDTWVSLLNLLPLPLVYGRELLFRLFVSWVFLDGITFATLTKVILYNSRGPMHSLGLPMSHQVIDAIEARRQGILSDMVSSLEALKEDILRSETSCSFDCSAIRLGALMKGTSAISPRWPPKPPFEGYSIMAMERAIRDIKEPSRTSMSQCCFRAVGTPFEVRDGSWQGGTQPRLAGRLAIPYFTPVYVQCPCSLSTRINAMLDGQLGGIRLRGLDIKEYGCST